MPPDDEVERGRTSETLGQTGLHPAVARVSAPHARKGSVYDDDVADVPIPAASGTYDHDTNQEDRRLTMVLDDGLVPSPPTSPTGDDGDARHSFDIGRSGAGSSSPEAGNAGDGSEAGGAASSALGTSSSSTLGHAGDGSAAGGGAERARAPSAASSVASGGAPDAASSAGSETPAAASGAASASTLHVATADGAEAGNPLTLGLHELEAGSTVQKYGRRGQPHLRRFQLNGERTALSWESPKKKSEASTIELAHVTSVQLGHGSSVFKRFKKKIQDVEHLSLTIVYGPKARTLDIVCRNKEQLDGWLAVLESLTGHRP